MGTPSCKFEIIHDTLEAIENRLSVSELCRIAGVSRSGYYNWLASAAVRDEKEIQDKAENYFNFLTDGRIILLPGSTKNSPEVSAICKYLRAEDMVSLLRLYTLVFSFALIILGSSCFPYRGLLSISFYFLWFLFGQFRIHAFQ